MAAEMSPSTGAEEALVGRGGEGLGGGLAGEGGDDGTGGTADTHLAGRGSLRSAD